MMHFVEDETGMAMPYPSLSFPMQKRNEKKGANEKIYYEDKTYVSGY